MTCVEWLIPFLLSQDYSVSRNGKEDFDMKEVFKIRGNFTKFVHIQ